MIDGLMQQVEGIASQLRRHGENLAVAESSTGGLISAALLALPGASAYYTGGLVVYTQAARALLIDKDDPAMAGIRAATEEYALLLAARVRERLSAAWAVAETGAAGPSGNRYGDPAGHSCIAVVGRTQRAITVRTNQTDRLTNMQTFAASALDLLGDVLRESGA